MRSLLSFDPFADFFGEDMLTPFRSMRVPTTDIYTNDNKELIVEAHLPNYSQDDVDIHIENGALVISAEKHEKEEDKKKKYVVRESASSFYRRIQLPERVDSDNIDARFENGVLHVTMPYKALPEPKKIAIKAKASGK